ncbi:sigma-70 family RNA polymerase sigma factor [Spongiivirga citrea]|uniref:Sigma-70 family RNA polymerase sigma factor n=1 Tax=Spongiivirga citrea TaxID=1481457 RepID=A0A6M0CFE8_9FLAO|nr:sigma-70 family RNA polymerase sigma factor [Spongiivirga citrea]NER16566.1 sigma-70 family RNA polymerase sigma factor [Spongiivirga citrea]
MKDNIQSYYKPLFGYINKRVKNSLDAEDLTQDVFLKLSQSDLSGVKNFKHWLFAITRNIIIDYYRKKKLEIRNLEKEFVTETSDNTAIIFELSQCVKPFIKELPQDYAQLLELHEIDGISQKEISEKLNINYVTVRSKIQRGRSKLRALFAQCCQVEKGGRGSILCYTNNTDCC